MQLKEFRMSGTMFTVRGYLDPVRGEPRFDILFAPNANTERLTAEELTCVTDEMAKELAVVKTPELVRYIDGVPYWLCPDDTIGRLCRDYREAKKESGQHEQHDRAPEGAQCRKPAQ